MISNKELFSKIADVEKAKREHQLKEPFGIWLKKTIRNNFEKHGDMPWMTDLSTDKTMKYGELIVTADRIGCALRKRGFRPNETVLFIASNHLEMAISYLAVWAIEGIPASLGLDTFPDEIIKSKAIETGAKFILTDQARAGQFQNAVRHLSGVKVIVIGGRVSGCIFFDDLLLEGAAAMQNRDDDGDDGESNRPFDSKSPVWLGFTSGTTGNPKGIIHSHSTMHLFAIYRRMSADPNPGLKLLATNGLIHCSGVCGMLDNMLGYGHQFVLSNTATAQSILNGIHRSKATTLTLYAHEVIQICGLSPVEIEAHQYDLSSVVTIKVPASQILPVYKRYMAELMPNLRQFNNVYAQTETMVLTALPSARSPSRADFLLFLEGPLNSSVGKNFPLVKLKFLDLITGQKVGPNEIGEIVASTPFLMDGYINKPEESSKIIRADGWFNTGDVGYYDPEGYIFFLGRISDLIRHNKSEKYIVPINIEEQMSHHPAVKDVAVVVGAQCEQQGASGQHVVQAFVALKNPRDECDALLEEIRIFTNERVSEEEKIRGSNIRFMDNIPRSDVGKIIRYKLTEQFLS